jgi:hypothetical protein
MRCQTVLLAVAFFAVTTFYSVSAQENGSSGAQAGAQPGQQASSGSGNEPESQEEVQVAEAAASSDQGSRASAEFWDPGNCGGEFIPTCCERDEDSGYFVSFLRNQCFCNNIGGRAVSWEQCFNRCRCSNRYRPVCCSRRGYNWWVTNRCQCRCFKGYVTDRSACRF